MDNVAIYIYKEYARATYEGEPAIESLNPDIVADKRHHSQQAMYTICSIIKKCPITKENKPLFCSHERLPSNSNQGLFKKISLPSSEKSSVLKELNLMNINSYALFHDEDGLAKHLAFQHLYLK